MKTVIVGYGSMGHEIEAVLLGRGHEVICRVDPAGNGDTRELSTEILKEAEGVIEFALPGGILDNIRVYSEASVPAVIGTTGWDKLRSQAAEIVRQYGSALLWGNNFSLGANLFFDLVSRAAALINGIEEYDIMVNEYHHKRKKDSPSGTALTIAEKILQNLDRKKSIQTETLNRAIRDDELHVGSVRGGAIPGIHRVTLDSEADSIEISHTARNRKGFALGAVRGIEWLSGKTGFFSVDDFIRDILPS
ncbi:4-hydroxy-tetrahydrodipicolinate reductase [Marispirochaeta aestuarii]|uniref:4-hydroxy-tetrahydrodipicolinate reductase n=1 Tax=Marispirochaeta aestuarii TaxID=1963862 RepID=UPI002ABD3AF6|nr:4-hydroxy-tetrahydrodipicolinate reductase [Marispirochaeta aestuarii]